MPMKRVLRLVCALTRLRRRIWGENGYRHARTADFAQSFPANVSYNEYQYAIVQARAAGFIDKVYPLTVGDKVQKGTPLLDLTIPDWVEAQTEYLLLRETGGTATQTEGILERLRLAGMPEADIRRLIATQKSRLALRSKRPLMA